MTKPLSIESFGAEGDGKHDNGDAIREALELGAEQGRRVLVPYPGVFAYSGVLNATDAILEGVVNPAGAPLSKLYALDTDNAAIFVRGRRAGVLRLVLSGVVPTVRTAPWETTRIVMLDGAEHWRVEGNLIEGGSGAGIMVDLESHHGVITHNFVHDTLADSIHMTGRCHHIVVEHNKTRNSGDDGIAVVSYRDNADKNAPRRRRLGVARDGDTGLVHHIEARHNDIRDNAWGRGMSVVGGADVLYEDNYIGNNKGAAGFIFAQEDGWNTFAAERVVCWHNTVVDCGNVENGHWAFLVLTESLTNTDINIERNVVVQHDKRGGIDVRATITGGRVVHNTVEASDPYRYVQGVEYLPFIDGPVGQRSES